MNNFRIRHSLVALAIALSVLCCGFPCQAQTWPARTITVVMPYAAGGATDVAVREIARKMADDLGQPIIIENKPGAGAMIGAQFVARAKPDGYTLLTAVVANMVTSPLTSPALSYDPLKDFSPISLLSTNPLILVASKSSGIKTFADMLRGAREKRGTLAIASYGYGTPSHLAIELLMTSANIEVIHVPYNGSAPAMVDVLGGRVPLLMDILPSQLKTMEKGDMVGIAVGQRFRSVLAPAVPTFEEVGLPGFEASTWFGIVAPAGTPKVVIARLNQAAHRALSDPELQRSLLARGVQLQATSPEEFGLMIRADYDKWGAVIKAAGIKAQ